MGEYAVDYLREHDPWRAISYAPTPRHPAVSDANPKGVRHIDKTRQDYMPVDQRPRVIAHRKRLAAMRGSDE